MTYEIRCQKKIKFCEGIPMAARMAKHSFLLLVLMLLSIFLVSKAFVAPSYGMASELDSMGDLYQVVGSSRIMRSASDIGDKSTNACIISYRLGEDGIRYIAMRMREFHSEFTVDDAKFQVSLDLKKRHKIEYSDQYQQRNSLHIHYNPEGHEYRRLLTLFNPSKVASFTYSLYHKDGWIRLSKVNR
ncbi:hypothetical protein PCASD_04436 [Puccinia coronata f. sp. avenae]|uniref:Uncharacterized protein n=1 Tax=Puccinia coronata f. sp. avenae TaxID=200324 RepID=A0A2N5VBV0_9BASI|nr:hypothetical protein PCASD_04436 [Puccinia coronata f. sp. avenae]